MRSFPTHCASRFVSGCLTVAVALSLTVSTASAQRRAKRVGREVAIGGITRAARAAQQNALHAELTARMPAGATDTPIRIELTAQDRADLAVQPNGPAPLRIGMTKSFPSGVAKVAGQAFGPKMPGKSSETPDGGFTWAVTVSSPGAQAIRVRIKDFSLPPGAAMYFYSLDGAADGPYVGKGEKGNGNFWTRSISSDTGVIQLRVPAGVDRAAVSFSISEIAHISGRVPQGVGGPTVTLQSNDSWPCSDNAPCVVDANCVSGTPADPAKDAIAKMEWISGPSVFTCSGGLLADTAAATQIPYFLTANHCFDASIPNLETWFNYTTDSCGGVCPHNILTGGAPPSDTVGITVLRTGATSDFTLGTLDQTPPAGAVFLGWNSTPIAFSSGAKLYRISNPNFGPQGYSQHDVNTSTGTCGGIARGNFIYSGDVTGATMGGSSGSPVLNSAGEVVGQLFGCCGFDCADECAGLPTNATVDGAFASYFDQIDDLLDPPIECSGDPDCDDLDPCTTDVCVSGSCSNTPISCPVDEICVGGTCVPVGACCVALLCGIDTAASCSASGGSYLGDGTACGSGEAGNPTVYASSPGITIPDGGGPGNPAADTINVVDSFNVGDVDIDLNITHTWVGDVTVTLTHLGTTVTVLDRPGVPASTFGCGLNNYAGIILDDEGTGGDIESQCVTNLSSPPSYTPNNPLSAFDGMNSAGDWIINVYDVVTPDGGTLDSWSIHIDETGSNPCTAGCVLDSECADGNECTDDICNAGVCENPNRTVGTACSSDGNACTDDVCDGAGSCGVNNSASCDDSVFCNGADTCSGGSCSIHAGDPCAGGGECADTCNEGGQSCNTAAGTACTDDGNACTDNECDGAGSCAANNNSDTCDDSVFCNGSDTCSGGSCSVHAGDPCAGGGECTDSCNEAGQQCDNTAAGTPCTPDGNVCTDDVCDGAGGCGINNSASCNDSVFCNGADTCSGGSCSAHAGDPCAAGAECANTCNEGAQDCNTGAGTSCTDDGNACTDNECDGGGNCAASNNSDACNDGDACTTGDNCSGGACLGGAAPNCNDGNVCTDDSCDSGSGCVNANNTASCDDGDLCTAGDMCSSGACVSGPPPDCDDLDSCTADSCDPGTGLCVNDPIVSCCGDGSCDGGEDQCTCAVDCGSPPGSETDCTDGSDEDCDGDTDCADTDCSGDPACSAPPTGQGYILSKNSNFSTDDRTYARTDTLYMLVWSDQINFNDLKKAEWELKSGDKVKQNLTNNFDITYTASYDLSNLPDLNENWQWKGKVEDNGGSKFQVTDNITVLDAPGCSGPGDCDDGDLCTVDDCVAGSCTNAPVDCNDADACTTDSCDPGTGSCLNDPISCNDGNDCTDDSCDSGSGCVNTNNTDPCDDGDLCTAGDTCTGGACVGGPPPNCDDLDPCTADSCDPGSGLCVNDPIIPCCGDTFCDPGEDQCNCPADCGSPPATETNCTDSIDEDCDNDTDCADSDCSGDPACTGPPTGEGYILSKNADFSTDDRTYFRTETLYILVFSDQIDFNDIKKAEWELKSGDKVKQNLTNNFDITYTASYDLSNLPDLNENWQWKGKVEDNGGSKFQVTDNITVLDAPGCSGPGDCDDGDLCTVDDCVAGSCTNTPVDCNDADACTADSCNPGTGSCVNDPISCDDGDLCTIDGCDSGAGCSNDPIDCDDGDPCTTDTCSGGVCGNDPAPVCCGDFSCDVGEDQCNCAADCGSPAATETNCTDSVDEDCDGDTDCADADCNGDPACSGPPITGQGFILSKNSDFSTDDRTFNQSDTLYMLIWSDQIDFNDLKKNEWELKDADKNKVKQNLTNNFDITYTAAYDLSNLPSSLTAWQWKGKVEDNAGSKFQVTDNITVLP